MGFADIVGQESAKRVIVNSLKAGRLASSYLFYGPRGVGKTATAFGLAKALNCREREADFCGSCPPCRRIESLNYPDLRVVVPTPPGVELEDLDWSPKTGRPSFGQKGKISIDTIRSLRKELSLKPFEGERRVIVILDADCMTADASNALLKSLEEPPLDTVFVLTTVRLSFLLPTILSRCQRIPFRRLKREEIEESLRKRLKLDKERARFVSLISDGSLGRALELAQAGRDAGRQSIVELISLRPEERWKILEEGQVEMELEETLEFLLLVYRDLLILKEMGKEGVVNLDLLPLLKGKAEAISSEGIRDSISVLLGASHALAQNVNPKLIWHNLVTQLT